MNLVNKHFAKCLQFRAMIIHLLCSFFFLDGFDFSDGWKNHLEESDKKARVILESYYKKCQESNVSHTCGIPFVHFSCNILYVWELKLF